MVQYKRNPEPWTRGGSPPQERAAPQIAEPEQLLHAPLGIDRLKAFRSFAEIAVASIGCALIAAAAAANQAWFDRHFLPSYWTPHQEIVRTEWFVRIGVAVAGAVIVLLAQKVA